jgi:hypothetical protein
VEAAYYANLAANLCFNGADRNASAAPVVYTPLHGVGLPWVEKVLRPPWRETSADRSVSASALTVSYYALTVSYYASSLQVH